MSSFLQRAVTARASAAARGMCSSALLLISAIALPGVAAAQCVSLTTPGSAYTQNFDTLSNTAGSTTNNLTIPGWFMTETGGGARDNEQYAVDTGASNTGDTFSYGAAGSTERALGSLQSGTLIATVGACFTNNSGATIGRLDIAYTGEQWRISNTAAARDDRLDFQYSLNATDLATGTWTDVNPLDFTNPIKTAGTAGALNGNLAANRTAISSQIAGLSIANGATFWIRWNDLNASGADDGLAIDDVSMTPVAALPAVNLAINDVSLNEGNAGTTSFTFTASLSAPAGPGGVSFDIATADGTAQDDTPASEDNDYVARSLTGQTIPAGSSTYAFTVLVNGDTIVEANETYFVNVTNVTGATVVDGQGQGTVVNDDVTLTPIHDIHGPGNSSPIVGSSVTTRGVVTGRKSNGFFLQEPDASVDADPATSEGIFVFTSAAPPAIASVGSLLQVTGTVAEFVPASDPLQPPMTQLTSPTATLLSPAESLPTAIPLTATFPDPAGPFDQLERLEGMRVSVASFTVTGATLGNINEANATATSSGVFHGTATGLPRPFREPGIEAPDPAPQGTIPPIPRWDGNPELLRVDSDGLLGATALDVSVDSVVTGIVGPLDYGFRRYTVLPDAGITLGVSGGSTPAPVTLPAADEVTIATYNLQRFFDTVNDPAIGEPVLTATAYDNRLAKASLGIRDYLHTPDIVGVTEVENLATLQDIATRIGADAIAAGAPDPQYVAYLVEGNDVGGIDVGYLVKTAPVAGMPRVDVGSVAQANAGELFVNADSSTEPLNDRPPLVLSATVHAAGRAPFPVVVINNHLRSLIDADNPGAGVAGWPSIGERVRAKRQAQANSLANLVQARQTADPGERLVLLGDFNAFEFNDGLGDSIGTIAGTPTPDNETAVSGDGVDLVTPDLLVMTTTLPQAQRYSYVEEGNAQSIDHLFVNAPLQAATAARRIESARINADFPQTARNAADVRRLSDHDPTVLFLQLPAQADLAVTIVDSPDPVLAGGTLTYAIDVANIGPDIAANATWNVTLPAGATFVSLSAPGAWSCTAPAVGSGGTVACSRGAFAVGSDSFTLSVAVASGVASGTVLSTTATASSTITDPDASNNAATATTTVTASADLGVTVTDAPDPVLPGANITYTITASSSGPSDASGVTLSDTLPASTTFVSLSAPAGWSCSTPAVGAAGTVTCTRASLPAGSGVFTLVVQVNPALLAGGVLSNTATITSSTSDPVPADNSATASTTVTAAAPLSVTMTDTPDPVAPGAQLTYDIGVTNAGPGTASGITLDDTLPAGTSFVSLAAGPWNCTTPPIGSGGSVTCTLATLAPGTTALQLVVAVDAALANGTVLSNSATVGSASFDPDAADNSAATTTTQVRAEADLGVQLVGAPDPAAPGAQLGYTITVDNAGPNPALSAQLTGALPAGTTFVSLATPAGWSCSTPAVGAGGAVTCTAATLAVGSGDFTLVVAIDADAADGGTLASTFSASASTFDPDAANNAATETITLAASADLSLTVTDTPDPVAPGTALSYAITLSNAGPSDAASVQLTDTLPAGTRFAQLAAPAGWSCTTPAVGDTGTISCSIATLAPGDAVFALLVDVDADVAQGTVLSNTATATSTTADPMPGASATATTTVGSGSADLSITLADSPDPATAGETLVYAIGVDNSGPAAATDTVVAFTVPANSGFVSLQSPAGYTCTTPAVGAAGAVSCSIASQPLGAAAFEVTVTVGADIGDGSTLAASASVSSATSDPDTADNSADAATAVETRADLSLSLADAPDPVAPGGTLTLTATVANAGPSDAADATLAITLPVGTTFAGADAPAGWTCTPAGASVSCVAASLPVGSATVTITADVAADVASGATLTASGSIAAATADPQAGNNAANTATQVGTGTAALSITKTAAATTVTAGGDIVYTLRVVNAGPANATDVSLVDVLPPGTSLVGLTPATGFVCSVPAVGEVGTVACTLPSFAPGEAVFALTARVAADAAGGSTIANTATVSSATADPVAADNTATASVSVLAPSSLQASKTVAGTPAPGSNVTYTIVLTNIGDAAQADNPGDELVDVLPAALTPVSATATAGTAGIDAPANTVRWNGGIAVDGSVTITIVATIDADAPDGSTITNQAVAWFDADGDGSNEASVSTDDPATATAGDGTVFVVEGGDVTPPPSVAPSVIPATSTTLQVLLGLLLSLVAMTTLRARRD